MFKLMSDRGNSLPNLVQPEEIPLFVGLMGQNLLKNDTVHRCDGHVLSIIKHKTKLARKLDQKKNDSHRP